VRVLMWRSTSAKGRTRNLDTMRHQRLVAQTACPLPIVFWFGSMLLLAKMLGASILLLGRLPICLKLWSG
jgi:hypothetical protein